MHLYYIFAEIQEESKHCSRGKCKNAKKICKFCEKIMSMQQKHRFPHIFHHIIIFNSIIQHNFVVVSKCAYNYILRNKQYILCIYVPFISKDSLYIKSQNATHNLNLWKVSLVFCRTKTAIEKKEMSFTITLLHKHIPLLTRTTNKVLR